MLKAQYQRCAANEERLNYARILGVLGDPAGAPALIAAIDAHDAWDHGSPLTSQRATGNLFSDLDRHVIALGFSRAPQRRASLLKKLGQLRPDSELSHYKAISLALWDECPADAAEPLARLLKQPGFAGYATIDPVVQERPARGKPVARAADRLLTGMEEKRANNNNLNQAFRELIVAALLYRCGDKDGLAQSILKQYAKDIHGHFAAYAKHALHRTPAPP